MVDRRGIMVLVNRETERLFGYHRDELIGQSIEMLVPAQLRARHPDLRATFHANPQARPMGAGRDLYGRRKGGGEIPVEIGLTPVDTDEGTFVLATVVDIGPRKQAEEELRRSNEELERFAYVASHDLQEPLRTVASYVQLLSRRYRDRLDGDAMDFIDFAVGGVRRMQHLIEDLLAFSRVGTRGAPLVPTELPAVLRATLDTLHAALEESGAEVTADEMPTVVADAGQVAQLLTNLIGNALKFRGAEAPRVHVGAERIDRHVVDQRARQRHRHRARVLRSHLRDFSAAACPGGVRRHRRRPGDLQEDRRAPWRPHLGRVHARTGCAVHLHPSVDGGLTSWQWQPRRSRFCWWRTTRPTCG